MRTYEKFGLVKVERDCPSMTEAERRQRKQAWVGVGVILAVALAMFLAGYWIGYSATH